MNITTNLLTKGHRVRPGTTNTPKYLVIHSVGNPDSKPTGERGWLDNPQNTREASWHYVVGADIIIQAIPDNEVAWHSSSSKYNSMSIGIEMIESEDRTKVIENTIDLVISLMTKYNIPLENVIRHYDTSPNKKVCPRIMAEHDWSLWNVFKDRIKFKLTKVTTEPSTEAQKASSEAWKLDGLKYLKDNGLISDYESWAAQIEEPLPAWASFAIMAKIHKDLNKK